MFMEAKQSSNQSKSNVGLSLDTLGLEQNKT